MATAGWILLGLFALFMVVASATPKFLKLDAALKPMETFGLSKALVLPIACMEVGFTALVLYPPTAAIGGVLATGLFGGAIITQIRVNAPLYSHTLFGVYLGCWMWLGICLRDPEVLRVFTGIGS